MDSQNDQPPGMNDATLVAPRAQQGSARLILKRSDGQLKEYEFNKDEITIGRLPANDIVLPDDRVVSRRHAVIRRSNAGYVIEDQQSNNGTFVDGEKILYPYVLHNGQSIKIGSNEMTFSMVSAPARPAGQEQQPSAPPAMPAPPAAPEPPAAQDPFFNQPIPQPAFDVPPPPAFNVPPQPAAFPQPPAPSTLDQPPMAFQPPPGSAYSPAQPFGQPPTPEQPPFGQQGGAFPAPPPSGTPAYAPGFQAPPQPAPAAGAGQITCQSCNQLTMANKAFCLNCGASLAAQSAPAAPPPGGANPFGAQPNFSGPSAAPMPGSGPQPWQPPPPPQPQNWQQPAPGQQPPPGPPAWQPPPPHPQNWQQPPPGPPPMPGPQPWQPPPPAQPQPWPGQPQPGPFGPGPQAPAPGGALEGTIFFPKGLRPIQSSDIHVRLTRQSAEGWQIGAPITIRISSPAMEAFYFSAPGITLHVPAPGAVEEGVLQITPLRQTPPGAVDQLLFTVVDANGQQIHPTPVVAEVVISYQPTPPYDGPGSLRLPI